MHFQIFKDLLCFWVIYGKVCRACVCALAKLPVLGSWLRARASRTGKPDAATAFLEAWLLADEIPTPVGGARWGIAYKKMLCRRQQQITTTTGTAARTRRGTTSRRNKQNQTDTNRTSTGHIWVPYPAANRPWLRMASSPTHLLMKVGRRWSYNMLRYFEEPLKPMQEDTQA